MSVVKIEIMMEISAQNSLSHLRLPNGLDVVQFHIPKSFGLADAVFTGQLREEGGSFGVRVCDQNNQRI